MYILDTASKTTALEGLFTNVCTVISKMVSNLTIVSEKLIADPIFQITIGIAMLFILIGIVFKLVKKMRKGGR